MARRGEVKRFPVTTQQGREMRGTASSGIVLAVPFSGFNLHWCEPLRSQVNRRLAGAYVVGIGRDHRLILCVFAV